MIEGLKITNVTIFPIEQTHGRLKAIVRVVLNEQLQLTNLRLYDGVNGLFVSYPVEFVNKGEEYRQVFYPVSKEFREYIETEVLTEYSKVLEAVA